MPSPRATSRKRKPTAPILTWADNTELVGLTLELKPTQELTLAPQYTTELHSWFLDQVRRINPELSAYLHDGQSEKPFTVSSLEGGIQSQATSLRLPANQIYQWSITALSQPVVNWMQQWLQAPPAEVSLRSGTFQILQWTIAQPATTYTQLLQTPIPDPLTLSLSFRSPTSFRRKGSHFPLPVPINVFQSYLRRWNDFSGEEVDQDDFLDWIDESVLVLRHELRSIKVMAGKRGSVTGFTGAVQFGLTTAAHQDTEFVQLFIALGQLAPYCGTGHKTTFGLGQTRLGWLLPDIAVEPLSIQELLAQRTAELTALFLSQRQRIGGNRATQTAETWATILARREMGESLQTIAADLEMPYETVKTYIKLARRAIKPS
jgi:CRISPR-associated endoribonuclease Cas6